MVISTTVVFGSESVKGGFCALGLILLKCIFFSSRLTKGIDGLLCLVLDLQPLADHMSNYLKIARQGVWLKH